MRDDQGPDQFRRSGCRPDRGRGRRLQCGQPRTGQRGKPAVRILRRIRWQFGSALAVLDGIPSHLFNACRVGCGGAGAAACRGRAGGVLIAAPGRGRRRFGRTASRYRIVFTLRSAIFRGGLGRVLFVFGADCGYRPVVGDPRGAEVQRSIRFCS